MRKLKVSGGYNSISLNNISNGTSVQPTIDSTALYIFVGFLCVLIAILFYSLYKFMKLNKKLSCADTAFGCCPDGTTPKTSVDDTCGKKLIGGCEGTQFGCCLDGKTAKKSHDDKC